MGRLKALAPNQVWMMVFGVWGVFLSGALSGFVGSPGIVQAVRLSNLLETKRTVLAEKESEIARLDQERIRLETSRAAQEREIRRVLGYAAADELIFDFTVAERMNIERP